MTRPSGRTAGPTSAGEGASLSLHARALDAIGQAVVDGDLPPGEPVLLDDFAGRLGVSRSVVREVVRVLESMGLVRSRRRVGVVVLPASEWAVFDPQVIRWRLSGPGRLDQLSSISQLRRGVEPLAARLAAAHADEAAARALSAAAAGMAMTARVPDLLAYLDHDVTFHTTLLTASGNEMFAALAPVVREVLAGRTHHHLMPATPEPLAVRLHATVAAAVAAGDGESAETAMRAIVDEAQTAMEHIAREG